MLLSSAADHRLAAVAGVFAPGAVARRLRSSRRRAARAPSASAELGPLALAFSIGAVAAHALPSAHLLWPCWLAAGVLLLPPRRLRLAAMALIGLGYGAWHCVDAVRDRIDAACAQPTLIGRVQGLPAHSTGHGPPAQRFLFATQAVEGPSRCEIDGVVRLVWFDGPTLRGGESWRLNVRLKPPRGMANPGVVDGGRYSARARLAAAGYVLAGAPVEDADAGGLAGAADRLRESLRDEIRNLRPANAGVLLALTLGDAASIPGGELERYRRTGTMHLLIISGLHVGIVTGLGFFLGRGAALFVGLPGRPTGVAIALLLAAVYVLLAGAGLSLVRAFAMACVGLLALAAGRSVPPLALLGTALTVVLLIDPMAPLAPGFWLSFGAVATLIGFFWPRPVRRSWLLSAATAQIAIALVFAPASAGITGLVHPLGIGVNLVAVPLVTLVVVPLALLGTLLVWTVPGAWLLTGADFGIAVLSEVLERADGVEPLHIPNPGLWLVWVAGVAAACLLPISRLAALAMGSAFAALLLWPLLQPRAGVPLGEVEVTALDVGQGLSVLVETAGHVLLYDAGAGFLSGGDIGASVVLPVLRSRGRARIDALVLSHGDFDHVGGARSVLAGLDVGAVHLGEPVPGISGAPCRAGVRWQWDGVTFAYLHPPWQERWGDLARNAASCVLLIESNGARVLLPGDIERDWEARLPLPPVDLLLVPHHGSATSSTRSFVERSRPRIAIVAAGWQNHFGHPHPRVVERYRDVGTHVLSTAAVGAVNWRSTRPAEVETVRCRESPYWRRDVPRWPADALSAELPGCQHH